MSVPISSRRLIPVLLLAAVSIAWAVASPAAPVTAPAGDGPDLHDLMKGIKKNMKTIGTSLRDPAADALVLDAIGEMEVLLLASKAHDPSNLKDVPRADRDSHRTTFRADMAKALIETLNLEIAVLEGRRDDAMTYVRGSLKDMRDAGHEKYEEGEDH